MTFTNVSYQLFSKITSRHLSTLSFLNCATNYRPPHTYCRTSLLIRTMSASACEDFQKEKEKFLNMPLECKRKLYKSGQYVILNEVPTWEEYFQANRERLRAPAKVMAECCLELAQKVSIWSGDITLLEIDAIVNAANSALAGGAGVDGAIHRAAGGRLLQECRALHGCPVGEAKLTGGYLLPAKYVIQTVGPKGENSERLHSCYQSSLDLAVANNLRTVAFPCISTGVYGYPQAAAARVAISSVRTYLEEHSEALDRIIFCVFLEEDEKLYENIMQEYFPLIL